MKFNLVKFKSKPKPKKVKIQTKSLECLNCGQPLYGYENFCSFCGQKNTIKKLSLGGFFSNLFSNFFSYDSRFWRTFLPLLFKPGQVSKEFIAGKRAKYVNPFKLYLNVSIIFFLILGITNKMEIKNASDQIVSFQNDNDTIPSANQQQIDSVLTNLKNVALQNIPIDSTDNETVAEVHKAIDFIEQKSKQKDSILSNTFSLNFGNDSLDKKSFSNKILRFNDFYKDNKKIPVAQALDSLGYEKSFWNEFYYQQTISINKKTEQFKEDGGQSFFKDLMSKISIALFVFLPLFTLFLKLFYVRRKYTYIEHLVFVFNTQTVFFLLLSIFYIIDFFIELSFFTWGFIILFSIYLYKALRNFYMQGRFKTIIKFFLLNFFYLFMSIVGLVIVTVISFLFS